MYRLDHLAFRVPDRHATVNFFQEAFGYKIQEPFKIEFDDGSTADCFALEPSEKTSPNLPWAVCPFVHDPDPAVWKSVYHMAPEIFVSDGPPGSIVGEWVSKRGGVGGIHHMAWQVDNVEETMKLWKEKGWAEFTSDKPMVCEGVIQVFTKPLSVCGGVIHEFIKRDKQGFCKANVRALMASTKDM
jgi:4-hydroxyphenylpyruvate dioxygenase-like putative hemolysin